MQRNILIIGDEVLKDQLEASILKSDATAKITKMGFTESPDALVDEQCVFDAVYVVYEVGKAGTEIIVTDICSTAKASKKKKNGVLILVGTANSKPDDTTKALHNLNARDFDFNFGPILTSEMMTLQYHKVIERCDANKVINREINELEMLLQQYLVNAADKLDDEISALKLPCCVPYVGVMQTSLRAAASIYKPGMSKKESDEFSKQITLFDDTYIKLRRLHDPSCDKVTLIAGSVVLLASIAGLIAASSIVFLWPFLFGMTAIILGSLFIAKNKDQADIRQLGLTSCRVINSAQFKNYSHDMTRNFLLFNKHGRKETGFKDYITDAISSLIPNAVKEAKGSMGRSLA